MEIASDNRSLFTRLVPILYVQNLDAERRFYESLGLAVTYEGPEYPDFIAIGGGSFEFGLERSAASVIEPNAVVTWQLGVSDVDEALATCERAGIDCTMRTHEPAEGWRYRTLIVRSPNGFRVVLEGPKE